MEKIIDLEQLRAAIKYAKGKGRALNDYELRYRAGMRDAEGFVIRLSQGWRFENNEWIAPENNP